MAVALLSKICQNRYFWIM